jgi:hypothetical protein
MSLFQRRPKTIVPREILALLPAYGAAVLSARAAGQPVTDPRFDWESFVGPVHTPLMLDDREQVIGELYEAAVNAEDRETATVGAYQLLAEFNPELEATRFLSLYDDALEYMRKAGFSSGHLTRFEADRWIATHGELRSSFDGIVEVHVPDADELPSTKPLEVGSSRMLALTEPLPRGNAFFAEHRPDGTHVVYSERPKSLDDPTRSRYEESHLGTFDSLEGLLRALAEMFGRPPHWSDQDLEPYFPYRRA